MWWAYREVIFQTHFHHVCIIQVVNFMCQSFCEIWIYYDLVKHMNILDLSLKWSVQSIITWIVRVNKIFKIFFQMLEFILIFIIIFRCSQPMYFCGIFHASVVSFTFIVKVWYRSTLREIIIN